MTQYKDIQEHKEQYRKCKELIEYIEKTNISTSDKNKVLDKVTGTNCKGFVSLLFDTVGTEQEGK